MLDEKIELSKLKFAIVYTIITLLLFSAIFYFVSYFKNNTAIVEITMRQTQTQNVLVHFEKETYNDKDYSTANAVVADTNYNTYSFLIYEDNIANLDLHLYGTPDGSNLVEIKDITVSTFLNKITLDEYKDYSINVENGDLRFNILDGVVFTDFQLTTKIKIVCLLVAALITLFLSRYIIKLCMM